MDCAKIETKNVANMEKETRLSHDKFNSTFGWRINVKKEFDYRKEPSGLFIVEGYSKLMQMNEMKNKDQLLLLSVSMLFEKRWIYKCSGVLIYMAVDNILLHPLSSNKPIILFAKDGDCVEYKPYNCFYNPYCDDMIQKMVDNYNRGYQRSLPLRVVK